jgi:hypothetical protein
VKAKADIGEKTNIRDPGVKVIPNNNENTVMSTIFGDDLSGTLCDKTNHFHQQTSSKYKVSQKTWKWTDITKHETKSFLGIILLMKPDHTKD